MQVQVQEQVQVPVHACRRHLRQPGEDLGKGFGLPVLLKDVKEPWGEDVEVSIYKDATSGDDIED